MDMDMDDEGSREEKYYDHSGYTELLRIMIYYDNKFRNLPKYDNSLAHLATAKQLREALKRYAQKKNLYYSQCLMHRFYLNLEIDLLPDDHRDKVFTPLVDERGRGYTSIFANMFYTEANIFPSESELPKLVYKELIDPLTKEEISETKEILRQMTEYGHSEIIIGRIVGRRGVKRLRSADDYSDEERPAVLPRYERAEKLVSTLLRYV